MLLQYITLRFLLPNKQLPKLCTLECQPIPKPPFQFALHRLRLRLCSPPLRDFDQKVNAANKLTQSGQISESLSLSGALTKEDEEMGRSALSTFMAKEEKIQKRKMEVQERVLAQMGRIEQENRRLSTVREVLSGVISTFFMGFVFMDLQGIKKRDINPEISLIFY
ncbi:unnamed protein product [Fraxinus pennsylvanica]|uniref:Uncharacterized protein n=1 Tax=Fraxinus pennsylvanica TaxID=56036 RepID=A0AAD1ZIZ4_9LAMI|nr:unnamed protein product [Fraxinus pennsylvanica]